jgi:hypothetical protein
MRKRAPSPGESLSRRGVVRRASIVTAVLAAPAVLLFQAFSPPARAARRAVALTASTSVEQAAVAPTVVTLTDAATISVNAAAGSDFRVTLNGSRTMGAPSNPVDGQQIIFQITQGSAGSASITWGNGYAFSTELPRPALSTTAGLTDLLGFIYNASAGTWLLAAFVNGFS